MKRIAFLLVAVAAVAGVVAYIGPRIWTRRWRGCPDLRNQNSPRIPRLEVDLRGPRRRQPQRFACHSGQRRSDQGLPGREASVPGRHNHCPASLELRPVGGKQQSLWPSPIFRCRARPGLTFSLWSRTQKSTPRRAAGGSLNSIRTANLPTRRCSKPASPATSLSKLATLSSPVTHLNTENQIINMSRVRGGYLFPRQTLGAFGNPAWQSLRWCRNCSPWADRGWRPCGSAGSGVPRERSDNNSQALAARPGGVDVRHSHHGMSPGTRITSDSIGDDVA